jgi:hypothetical protein
MALLNEFGPEFQGHGHSSDFRLSLKTSISSFVSSFLSNLASSDNQNPRRTDPWHRISS